MFPRTLWLTGCAAVALMLASCGGSDGGSGGKGMLIISRPDGIFEVAPEAGATPVQLVAAGEQSTFFLDPAVSPDASRIAYIVQPPPVVVDGRYDAGSDLWIADRDGQNQRLLVEHDTPNQLIRSPRWIDDTALLAIVQELELVDGVNTVIYALQRIDAGTGERERVIEDVFAFDISPDGQRIAYARLDPRQGESLSIRSFAGADNLALVDATDNLAPFSYPRFSPDGETIAFASADQSLAPPTPTGRRAPSGAFGGAPGVSAAPPSDGLPQDIWTVATEGSAPRRIADLKEDLPALTWDGAGERVYVLGVYGLYEIELSSGSITRLGEGAFHGQVAWAP